MNGPDGKPIYPLSSEEKEAMKEDAAFSDFFLDLAIEKEWGLKYQNKMFPVLRFTWMSAIGRKPMKL